MAQTLDQSLEERLQQIEAALRSLQATDWTTRASAEVPDGTERVPLSVMATAPAAAAAAQVTADTATAAAAAAASDAAEAFTAANGRNRIFTQPDEPTGTFIPGDVWMDTDNDNRLSVHDGTGWVPQQFGTSAISATAITADLLAATAVDGKTITGSIFRTAPSGPRVQIDSTNGLVGYNASGVAVTSVGTNGLLTATGATITGEIRTAPSGKRVRLYSGSDVFGTFHRLEFNDPALVQPGVITHNVTGGTSEVTISAGSTHAGDTVTPTAFWVRTDPAGAASVAMGVASASRLSATSANPASASSTNHPLTVGDPSLNTAFGPQNLVCRDISGLLAPYTVTASDVLLSNAQGTQPGSVARRDYVAPRIPVAGEFYGPANGVVNNTVTNFPNGATASFVIGGTTINAPSGGTVTIPAGLYVFTWNVAVNPQIITGRSFVVINGARVSLTNNGEDNVAVTTLASLYTTTAVSLQFYLQTNAAAGVGYNTNHTVRFARIGQFA